MDAIELKKNFIRIGKLRDEILSHFTDIEMGKIVPSPNNKTIIDKLGKKIEDFIILVDGIQDIHEYDGISFRVQDNSGHIVSRAFSEDELDRLHELWLEDAGTFETRFKMFVYEYALIGKAQSIARLYNSTLRGSGMTTEIVRYIISNMVMKHINTFVYNESFFKRLAYSTVPGVTIKRTFDTIVSDFTPKNPAESAKKKEITKALGLYSIVAEGFYNPFDDIDPNTDQEMLDDEDYLNYNTSDTKKQPAEISKIKLWNTNTKNKVIYKNDRMYAGQYFCKDDIIEESPIKIMTSKDLYSENIRNNVFEIDAEKGLYAFPLGYSICYRNSKEAPQGVGNIYYYFNDDNTMIIFYALKNIKRGQELIIQADDNDFGNELLPNQFKYNEGPDPIYTTKNIKFV